MKITIEAETDEERKSYEKPIVLTDVHTFALSALSLGSPPFVRGHGWWPDIKTEAARIVNRIEWDMTHGRADDKS